MNMDNKKGFIQFGIIAIALAVIVVGFLAFNPFKAKASGLTEEQVNSIIDKTRQENDVKTQPSETRDNNDATSSGESTTENTPTTTQPTQECVITGKWTELWVKEKMGIDNSDSSPRSKSKGIFTYTGTCSADIYLEAGIIPQSKASLAIMPAFFTIPSTPSWCDGNLNYYGHLWKGVKEGQKLAVDFKPLTPKEEGTYRMVIGAYTGCISTKSTDKPIASSGQIITDNTYNIRISDRLYENSIGVETIEGSQSWERKQ